jgi:MFS family permease
MAITPCATGLICWSIIGGAGAALVEVLSETALQRDLPEEVFARAYGIAFPAAIAGIVVGSLVAAPVVSLVGLSWALVGTGALAAGYAAVVVLPRRSQGRHRPSALQTDAVPATV